MTSQKIQISVICSENQQQPIAPIEHFKIVQNLTTLLNVHLNSVALNFTDLKK